MNTHTYIHLKYSFDVGVYIPCYSENVLKFVLFVYYDDTQNIRF